MFAAEQVRDVVDIVPGKAMAHSVVTAGGTFTVINVHGPCIGSDFWASKAAFQGTVAMYAAAKSAGGTKRGWSPQDSPPRGDSGHCGKRVGSLGQDTRQNKKGQPTREGHKPDSLLLNAPLVPWAMPERPYVALGRSPAPMGSDHSPVFLSIPVAMAAKERITRLAYSQAQGKLHAIRVNSPGVREAVSAMLHWAWDDPALKGWLSSDHDTATMGTPEVQAVFDLLYAFRDVVSRVTRVCMPSGLDPHSPNGQADTEASLPKVLTDQESLAWQAQELWRRYAEGAGHASREAATLLQHLRQWDPDLSPATVEDLGDALDQHL